MAANMLPSGLNGKRDPMMPAGVGPNVPGNIGPIRFTPPKPKPPSAQEVYNNSGVGSIGLDDKGQQYISGGANMYGFNRPDQYLMRGENNEILDPYKESVGDSYSQLRNSVGTVGSDVDSRAKVSMGDSYSKLKEQAMGTGDLESTAFAREQANNQTLKDIGRLGAQTQGNLDNSLAQMSMRGGVSAGAGERMARNAGRESMSAQQNIMAQNRDANINLSMKNGDQRNAMLQDVGRVENDQNTYNANAYNNNLNRQLDTLTKVGQVEQGVQQSNIGAARADLDKQNLGQQNLYGEDMQLYGASMTAAAQKKAASASKGGCFITTACVDVMGMKDDCWVLETARNFRDTYMVAEPERAFELAEYYQTAPSLLEKINLNENRNKILKSVFWRFIIPFCSLVKQNKLEDARGMYKEMMVKINDLMEKK